VQVAKATTDDEHQLVGRLVEPHPALVVDAVLFVEDALVRLGPEIDGDPTMRVGEFDGVLDAGELTPEALGP